jgi:4-amino-4-deoxychorismate lyase
VESALREGGAEPGLRLIETVLWDGRLAPYWRFHAARAKATAAALGWPSPVGAMTRALMTCPAGVARRVRLTADRTGAVMVEPMALPAPAGSWRVGIATERLASADPWLRVKTTNRGAYDRARANLPEGLDEVILLNERGEVCDGTITTVFFSRGGGAFGPGHGMRTPPLASGLLPGVLRARLACPEDVLLADELPKVRLWVGNALRGLIPAVFVPRPAPPDVVDTA